MTEKEKRQGRQHAEDAAFNRMLFCLLGVVLAEAVVPLVKRFYVEGVGGNLALRIAIGLGRVFSVFNFVGIALIALGVIWSVLRRKQNKPFTWPVILTVAVACLWVISVVTYFFFDAGIKLLVALPFAAAVLILIYFLYQKTFFVAAVLNGLGILGLWSIRQSQGLVVKLGVVAGCVVLIAVAAVAYLLKKNGGKLGKIKLTADNKSYITCWINCAVVLVAVLIGLAAAGLAYYLLYVLIAWMFCQAVYFTVKMM